VQDDLKRAAAEKALELVRDGMLLGLGSGTTALYFTEGVGRLVADGMNVRAVPTSRATAELAAANGIPVVEDLVGQIDLAVDGADEVDPGLSLIKGRGGALFREKLVAAAARRFVVVVDESKMVERLGAGALPVEVLPFLWRITAERLAELCSGLRLRGGEEKPYVTDNGNLILDLSFEDGISDATALAASLKAMTGVVEHGLFIGLAGECIVGGTDGVRVVSKPI
jgi:ribose 5-phosphate isomerase A